MDGVISAEHGLSVEGRQRYIDRLNGVRRMSIAPIRVTLGRDLMGLHGNCEGLLRPGIVFLRSSHISHPLPLALIS